MSTDNLDAVDLASVIENGLIHEDVMDRIYEIDPDDRPVADSIGRDSSDNQLKEFAREILETANPTNAYVDGQSLAGVNDTQTGNRYANYHQQAVKVVRVSQRGRNVNSIGTTDQMLWQLSRRQKALRRDEEAILTYIHGAQPGDGNEANTTTTGPGLSAGLASCLHTNTYRGATGADATFSGGGQTGGYPQVNGGTPPTAVTDWPGMVPGNKQGLTESLIKGAMKDCYKLGGNPSLFVSSPDVIEGLSDYLFTSSARVATIQTNVAQGNRMDNAAGGGVSGGGVVAQGAVNLFVTNFGTLELAPDRFINSYTAADTGDVYPAYVLDPEWFSISYLEGYVTKELAREGLADNSYISVDLTLCYMAEHSSALIADVDPTITVIP